MGRKFLADDFSGQLQEIEDFVKIKYPEVYNSFKVADEGQMLFDVLAHVSSGNSFKVNKKVLSIFLADTKSKTVVSRYARMFNYTPDNGSGSTIDVLMKLNVAYAFPVEILPSEEGLGPDDSVFYYSGSTPIVFAAGETEKTFAMKQGRRLRKFFISNGGKNQVLTLSGLESGEYIEPNSIIVKVDGIEWTEYKFLPFESVNAFEPDLFSDIPKIRFGNGIIGNIPGENVNIEVEMRVHKGKISRVGDNSIKSFSTPLVVRGETISYSFTHESSSGGFGPESMDSVKINAPLFHESQDRAVTTDDYNILAIKKESIIQAYTHSPRSISEDFILNAYLNSLENQITGSSIEEQGLQTLNELKEYLGDIISDTCKANTVMSYCLSVDENNKYIAPTNTVLNELESELQSKADAVHTVKTVSGMNNIVPIDVDVAVGFSINADAPERLKEIEDSLIKKTDDSGSNGTGFGLLIRRNAGEHLFLDKMYEVTKNSLTKTQNLISININITSPTELLDSNGNLILDNNRKIIEANNVTVRQVFNETTRI